MYSPIALFKIYVTQYFSTKNAVKVHISLICLMFVKGLNEILKKDQYIIFSLY